MCQLAFFYENLKIMLNFFWTFFYFSFHTFKSHTGQMRPYYQWKAGGLLTTLEGGKWWKNSKSRQKTEFGWADFAEMQFHDFKVNSVLSTFFILSYLSHINKYNEILHFSVTRLHSSVGRALNLRLEDCRFKSSFFHCFFA